MSDLSPPHPVEEIANSPGAPASALGHDPFDDFATPDPLVERLDQLEARGTSKPETRARPRRPSRQNPSGATPIGARSTAPRKAARSDADPPKPDNLARLTRRRWTATPPLAEIELPPPKGLVDRLLNSDERRILTALAHLVDGEASYDRFGYSPEAMKKTFLILRTLYRFYFRVRSEGHEHIPDEGPTVLACNHGGLLPFDAAMAVIDGALHTDPPRLIRTIVDRWAGSLPWINLFYARVGQVIGTRENFDKLLREGQLLLVFPEGIEGMRKTYAHRYRLQEFRVGFIEHALRAGAPIVPMAVIGSDDQSPVLFDVKPLARKLGLPVAPITPTFPWLGPLGMLPYPVSYRIVYGEPLRYYERFGPEGADDSRLVRYLANQVRRAVQQLIDRNRQ